MRISFFPGQAARGGGWLSGRTASRDMSLSDALRQPDWYPRLDKPTWRLQGHFYHERECVEMASLWGCAMCYRRSAVTEVGGWFVPGQSPQIFREEQRYIGAFGCAGYTLMMTTGARLASGRSQRRRASRSPKPHRAIFSIHTAPNTRQMMPCFAHVSPRSSHPIFKCLHQAATASAT